MITASTMNPALRFTGLSVLCILIGQPSDLHADGGTIRLSERAGGYRITIFTDPTPLRAGSVDVSVFVQDADTGEPAAGVRIMVQAALRVRPNAAICHAATTELATNKLFQSAIFELSETGWWDIEVTVDGEQGQVRLRFEAEVAGRPPSWQTMAPWVSWPALAVLLFAFHQWLVRRKTLGPEAAAGH